MSKSSQYKYFKVENKNHVTFYNPSNKKESIEFIVAQVGVANKTGLVIKYIETILLETNQIQNYYNLMNNFYVTQDKDIIYQNIDYIIEISKDYCTNHTQHVDFESFVDEKKKTRNSILVTLPEVKQIYLLSCVLKLYMLFSGTNILKYEDDKIHKLIFKSIIDKLDINDVINKLYKLVSIKIFRSSGMDPMILETLKLKSIQREEDFILSMFDFIMTSIIVIYDMVKNPIVFLVTSVDQMAQWEFRDLYSKAIMYKETGDLFDTVKTSANLIDTILNAKMLDVVSKYVTYKLKQIGIDKITILRRLQTVVIDENFYNYLITPFFSYVFNIKQNGLIKLSNYDKILIQLLFYFSIKDYLLESDQFEDFNIVENIDPPYLEILKRIAVKEDTSIDLTKIKKKYTSYQLSKLKEILSSPFKFYGITNKRILIKYIKTVIDSIVNTKYFKDLLSNNNTTYILNKKKLANIENFFLDFFMVVLDKNNEKHLPRMIKIKQYIRKCIKDTELVYQKQQININDEEEEKENV